MEATVLAPAYGFAWLPLAKEQHEVARQLYDRYCERFALPRGGNPGGQYWLGIVEDGTNRLAGVLGVSLEPEVAALEVNGLYVYPTRRGIRALEATVKRIAELYDAGHLRFVCCHVLLANKKMERRVTAPFHERRGGVRAHLWAAGSVQKETA
jgi:hypothetical protein